MSHKTEYEDLIREIRKHDRLYYVEYRPEISDYAYDKLFHRLKDIEQEHPEWIKSTSPTQRVGDPLDRGFKQASHTSPMLSLDNTYSKEELEEFIKRVTKLLDGKVPTFYSELKMDGVAVSVRYEQGVYVRALTRGDGKQGDDITANMKTISSLPLQLLGSSIPDVLEVRGEVFMSHQVFHAQNAKRQQAGEELWANPRNAAAGSLKLLDPKETASRKLSTVFYGIAESYPEKVKTQEECHEWIEKLGLPGFDREHRKVCTNSEDIMAFADKIEKARAKLPFDIDGIVIKVNDLHVHALLGSKGKSPRFAVAYKFAPEQVLTRIKEITVQVGRTGTLTPVAELEPVFVAGSTISRATLHNQEEVERKDIREGDWVWIEKGGDVIPKVVKVEMSKRPGHTHPWNMPTKCPMCGTPVVHTPGEVAVRCPNKDGCVEQKIRRFAHFVSKHAMDIDNLGEKVIEQLINKGLVRTFADLYTLGKKDLEQLEGFKEKSIQNLLQGINKSRTVSLSRLIMALGIKYIGEGAAELLAERAEDLETLAHMKMEELLSIEGIGEKMAQAVVDYFTDSAHLKEIRALFEAGVSPQRVKRSKHMDHLFSGKTFVLTGTLEEYSRAAATMLIKERGGKVTGSVSQQTDYVLAGEEAGSKLDKAQKLNIRILSEQEFKKLL